MITGILKFKEKKSEKLFLTFTEKDQIDFQNDLTTILNTVKPKMDKIRFYECRITANHRFSSNRYFRVVMMLDLTPNQNPFIYIEQFTELKLDEYLDSINASKNEVCDGFIEFK